MPALPQLNRQQLAEIYRSEAAIRAYEALQKAMQFVPEDIERAQAAADDAQADATAAGSAAAAAQADIDAVEAAPFLTVGTSAVLPNERALAVDPLSLMATDGGPGAAFTISTADLTAVLPADIADSTAAFVNAPGLSLTLLANATYLVDALLTFQSAATTTGLGLAFTLPVGATISGGYSHNTTVTAVEGSYNNAAGVVKGNTTGVLTAADNVPVSGRWIVVVSATAGSAQMQFRSEIAASAVTLKAGLSALIARRIA